MLKKLLNSLLILLLLCSPCLAGVDLNGDADWINFGDVDMSGATEITVSGWAVIDTDDFDGSVMMVITDAQGDPSNQNGFFLALDDRGSTNATNGIKIDIDTTSNVENLHCDNLFDSTATWYHILFTYGNDTTTVYLNGSPVSCTFNINSSGAYVPSTNDDLKLGNNNSNVYYKNKLSEFSIWKKALTANEIKLLASSKIKRISLQIQPDSLVFYAPLDDFEDGTALNTDAGGYKDLSGNENNGQGVDADGDSSNVAETVLTYP